MADLVHNAGDLGIRRCGSGVGRLVPSRYPLLGNGAGTSEGGGGAELTSAALSRVPAGERHGGRFVRKRASGWRGGDQSVESWCFNARAVMMSKDFAPGLKLPYLGKHVGPALEWTASLHG